MTLEQLVHVGTLISVAVAAGGLVMGVRIYRRQMNAQLMLEYTRKYEEIMETFPAEAREARLDLNGTLPDQSEGVTITILRYLNMSSEEYYLYTKGYLSKSIWDIWKDELDRTLCSPLIRREWIKLAKEFESYPEFYK